MARIGSITPAYRPPWRQWLAGCLLLLVGLCGASALSGQRVNTTPDALSLLAELLIDADMTSRAGFSDILLSVLHDAYGEEIRLASAEKPGSPRQAAKLGRWTAAMRTQQLAFANARMALSTGADVDVRVDRQRQVLIFVDDQAVAFAAPRPGLETALAQTVVARYCALYDCRLLNGLTQDPGRSTAPAKGNWSLRAGRPPAYEVPDVIRCTFRDFSSRQDKQLVCQRLADEAWRLAEAIRQARDLGHVIDWHAVRQAPRRQTPEMLVDIDANGNHVSIVAPHLAGIAGVTWPEIVDWLEGALAGRDPVFSLQDSERWLPSQGADNRD
jgi:hypothetical protein